MKRFYGVPQCTNYSRCAHVGCDNCPPPERRRPGVLFSLRCISQPSLCALQRCPLQHGFDVGLRCVI